VNGTFDIVVIGGGHAGTEAAWAAASVLGSGARIALVTMEPSRIGQMSCNPAIGGLAKGQIVREIDAMGGIMGRAIDATGVHFKMLNASKGAAARGPRAQADKYAYAAEVQRLVATRPEITVIAGTVDRLDVSGGCVRGVFMPPGAWIACSNTQRVARNLEDRARADPIYPAQPEDAVREPSESHLRAGAVVLTTGTFMRALMHTGQATTQGGRAGEGSAEGISQELRRLGFELGRLKTGTPPRLARESIDWSALEPQRGDDVPTPFSDLSPDILPSGHFPHRTQIECRLTSTCAASHELIRRNLHRAPMYSGQIDAECGPRYCPSIEDKVVRFADRTSHHVFLEPESLHTNEIYCNGISTSLPADVQDQVIRAMPGCAQARVLRWGYAVEYDMVWPHQIDASAMTRRIEGLFLAGQINCTTGYEEAGAQGLVAGLNAARFVQRASPIRLARDESYIGVLMDDLVTKTPREPYRMFTSRAEFRLHLRADNADERLTPRGREWNLVDDGRWQAFETRQAARTRIRDALRERRVGGDRLEDVARRPTVSIEEVARELPFVAERRRVDEVVTHLRYEGYLQRQEADVRRARDAEHRVIPPWLDFASVQGLRREATEVLSRFRPATFGQASRLPGVNPADLTLVAVAMRRGAGFGGAAPEGGARSV